MTQWQNRRLALLDGNTLTILVLDDDLERCKQFRRQWQGHLLLCVHTAQEAIDMLETFRFDLVFLDHDLGGEVFVDSAVKNTGAEVARWLEDPEHKPIRPHVVVIHTFNPTGRRYMAQALPWALVCTDGAWLYPPNELEAHMEPASRYAGY